VSQIDLDLLLPKVREFAERLIAECAEAGFTIIVSRGFRTPEEQNEYYAQGRTKPGSIITMVEGGSSFHNYGAAFDIRPILSESEASKREEYYRRAGEIGMRLGLEWGGTWKEFLDLPHFQYTAGYSIDDFRNGRIDLSKFAITNDVLG
jgi:peptidoglycan L-alanyl-D-glutamate endopeptidase CwlK